jgi:hypothetical protein
VAFWGEKIRFSLYRASFETADDLTGLGARSIDHRNNEPAQTAGGNIRSTGARRREQRVAAAIR